MPRESRKRRRSRKRPPQRRASAQQRPADSRSPEEPAAQGSMARGYARGRARDEAARAALRPLGDGERPTAVTVAGLLALFLGLSNLIAYVAGVKIGGERPPLPGLVSFAALMLLAAWGCWRVRYWAVLGMQTLLGLIIVIFSLFLIRAGSLAELAIGLGMVLGAGSLFWFLIRAMARIQMPDRPGA